MLLAITASALGQQRVEELRDYDSRILLYDYIREDTGNTRNTWVIEGEADTSTSAILRILPGAELTSWHQIQHVDDVMDYTVALESSNISQIPNGATEIWTVVSATTISDTIWTEIDWGVVEAHYIRFEIRPVNNDWTTADTLTHVGIVFENK